MLTLITHSWSGCGAADREAVTDPGPITAFSEEVCIRSVSVRLLKSTQSQAEQHPRGEN